MGEPRLNTNTLATVLAVSHGLGVEHDICKKEEDATGHIAWRLYSSV